jgi:hypothetical protein
MATIITIANGKFYEESGSIYCRPTTNEYNDKQYQSSVYDTDSKQASKSSIDIVLRDRNTGEEVIVDKFTVALNNNKKEDWHPDYQVKVKIG